MRGKWLNILLFALTVFSTYYILRSWWYSLALISILLAHEMGHFVMSRRHGVPASLPYFLPVPLPPFGTFGAIIKMKGRMSSRKALFDIGVAGPLMGLLVTIPTIIIGLLLSDQVLPEKVEGALHLGNSLLFVFLEKVVLGPLPEGHGLSLHPVAYAGWVGLFVTALNLLPAGQLDGGHIAYALFGRKSKIIFGLTIMLWMGISIFFYVGWALMIVLVFLFGFRHPPPLDDVTPLDLKRKILGVVVFFLFVLSFTPIPLTQAPGGIKDILQSALGG